MSEGNQPIPAEKTPSLKDRDRKEVDRLIARIKKLMAIEPPAPKPLTDETALDLMSRI
jgi:hypothetical protein